MYVYLQWGISVRGVSSVVIADGGGETSGSDIKWHSEIFPLIQWINTACPNEWLSLKGAVWILKSIVREGSFLTFRLYADLC
ncbi:hypothetical protein AAGU71_13690 [Edwardsiella ictaluri]|uniref:hypothetical protein n=1 Tax=Edwardsiella ictaluri TaxID=67780 RepID=UPI0025740B27|nr:hypothetical protein [Edwardsiella ictaluri]